MSQRVYDLSVLFEVVDYEAELCSTRLEQTLDQILDTPGAVTIRLNPTCNIGQLFILICCC